MKVIGKGIGLDASGKPVDVPLSISLGDRSSISFENTKFIHLADVGKEYILEVTLPDTMKGAFVSFSLTANKLFEFIEPMQPRPGAPASTSREANRNQIFASFQTKAERSASAPATFKPVSQWYAPTGEPPDYKSANKRMAKQMDVARLLAGMEAVRNTFHLVTEEGIRKGDLNQVDRETIQGCLDNPALQWSDITIHYYCAHSTLRSCYRGGIRTTAGLVQAAAQAATDASTGTVGPAKYACAAPAMDIGGGKTVPVAPGSIRAYVWQRCSALPTAVLADSSPPANFIPGAPSGAGCPAGSPPVSAYVPTEEERQAFSWLTASKDRAELFRYMMDAPTFGFSDQDQQDVINAFWRVRNPADKAECNEKRPRRVIDAVDGTHCLAAKTYTKTIAPTIGRSMMMSPHQRGITLTLSLRFGANQA
ncbi:MAG: hypothetical protein IOD12_06610 [Silvanigrellales bacterium]|nr:hypothetical protein [Silvanigrellales bacterium]